MILRDGACLYHGSYTTVEEPDLSKCRGQKDFGQGFYLTTDHEQARRFVRASVRKAVSAGAVSAGTSQGYVSVYQYRQKTDSRLRVFEFQTADAEWLSCIVAHRRPDLLPGVYRHWEQYDILTGKIANDNTNPTIVAYMSGLYGPVGSDAAVRQAIRLLMPFRLKNQVCFRTEQSLQCLQYIRSEKISWQIK